jgi:hypothetical protein
MKKTKDNGNSFKEKPVEVTNPNESQKVKVKGQKKNAKRKTKNQLLGTSSMLAALSTIAPLAKMLFSTVDKAIPDKDLAEKLKAQLNTQLLQSSTEEIKAAASIVEAEAKSHWFCF